MRSRVPAVALRARQLLQHAEHSAAVGRANSPATPLWGGTAAPYASAAAGKPAPPSADKAAAAAAAAARPAPGSPTAAAQAAAAAAGRGPAGPTPAAGAPASPSAVAAAAGPGGGDASGNGGSGGGGGGGWVLPVMAIAGGGGAYYYYTQQQQQGQQKQGEQPLKLDGVQQAALDLAQKGKAAVQGLLPASWFGGSSSSSKGPAAAPKASPAGAAGSSSSSSASSSSSSGPGSAAADRLLQQKQHDAQELGFKMLPPGADQDAGGAATTAAAAAAGGDAAAAGSTAARDAMSAAADEFPGLTSGAGSSKEAAAAAAQQDTAAGFDVGPVPHIDVSPIVDLFADVTGAAPAGAASTTPSSSKQPTSKKAAAAAPPAAPPSDAAAYKLLAGLQAVAAGAAGEGGVSSSGTGSSGTSSPVVEPLPLKEVEDSELERLCRKLGLTKDVAPSGLVASANKAGLGAVLDSSGTPVSPQLAQQRQATADARLLGELLREVAASTATLQQQLEAARRERTWAEEAAAKSEAHLTEHFKELLREQSRISQGLTEAAVKEAEARVMADAAAAQLQERRERAALIDELRAKVNSLAVAFDQRTAQLRSAHEVHKISLGLLGLSKALEEGRPVAQQLQALASSCPDDPLLGALASSLPPAAAEGGLPTLRQLQGRFRGVAGAAREAAYFGGEGEGGVLAHLVAKLAAALKVDAVTDDGSTSIDSKLSQARALVQQGQLSAAADAVAAAVAGTQAAGVVEEWVADARARAVADQAGRLLQAHAAAVAAANA